MGTVVLDVLGIADSSVSRADVWVQIVELHPGQRRDGCGVSARRQGESTPRGSYATQRWICLQRNP
jgi:hypothetical protein